MSRRLQSLLILVCCSITMWQGQALAKRTPRATRYYEWQLAGYLQPGFQSNVFKAPQYSDTKDDNLNVVGIDGSLLRKFGRKVRLEFRPSVDLDLYSRYTQRNQTRADGRLGFTWYTTHHWRFRVRGDLERANRDLIDDSGEFTGRRLAKWVTSVSPDLRFRNRWLRFELDYARTFSNYDEDTDSFGRPLISYDYDEHTLATDWHLEPWRWLQLRFAYGWDWRDYDERRTLSRDKKHSELRSFEQWTATPQLAIVAGWIEPYIKYSHTLRTDAYENFYGYEYDRIEFGFRAEPGRRLGFDFSFEYKEKDYPNYWTSRIGRAHRVSIQYRDWRVKAEYLLSPRLNLITDLRWYVKTSNDRNFDYRQLSLFAGFEFMVIESR